ncbi:hypothetical protein BJ875DRAFT_85163 [Amylocarpus encephaloides]|uniref:AB hydrolase-1 domain-containing protein n=1 Tax=Amylocarpus encephaloides TaxID=45428 RepID=A0A9P8CA85_9HELO|nr:hypothetical protein BJ875DRAFT_85163 [Amylocarpus encephaloides]
MATPNPLGDSQSTSNVSVKTFHIAGILTDVYGLEELSPNSQLVSCLWLLHPRLQKKETMANVATACITAWNSRSPTEPKVGLIAVAFDQRNHGTREVNDLANQAWRQGNPTHAQDMFSIFHGTALDTSLLIDHLGSYVFHDLDQPSIDQHIVMGISLGGHSAWQVLFSDARVASGIVIVGCPDYMNMMTDRARLSKLPSYTSSSGSSFLGSKDFPNALIASCQKYDPKGLLFGTHPVPSAIPDSLIPYQGSTSPKVRSVLSSSLAGKSILVCSGGDDKLVPYRCSEPFLTFLKGATRKGGWWEEGGVHLEDNVYDGVGHMYSEDMKKDTVRFVCSQLENKSRTSKI